RRGRLQLHGLPRRPGDYQGDQRRGQGANVVRQVRWALRDSAVVQFAERENQDMKQLVLTPEQAQQLRQAQEPVELCDPAGAVVARLEPEYILAYLAELKRRANAPGPRYTGAQVQARLQALQEEWDRTGGFDHAHMQDFLSRLDEKDPPHYVGPRGQA